MKLLEGSIPANKLPVAEENAKHEFAEQVNKVSD
jgi:hypothetical protein